MMMFAAIPLFLMMVFVANGGYLVAEKARLQNSADTAALVEATWTARSLNIISMNNTAAVQSHAISAAGMAIERPLLDAGLTGGLISGFYIGRMIGIGRICPPWCFLFSVPVFLALFTHFEKEVLSDLLALQEEAEYAQHDARNEWGVLDASAEDRERGFARAAASFTKMNRILVEKFPEHIDLYSKSISAANYDDAGLVTQRYTAWSPDHLDPLKAGKMALPVVEQSIEEAIREVGGIFTDEDDEYRPDNHVTQSLIDALAKIKDVEDFYNAGLHGTKSNPYTSISLDYFGNFKKHGYTPDTSPFTRLEGTTHDAFQIVHDKLIKTLDGNVPVSGGDAPWFLRAILKLVKSLIRSFIGTPYEEPGVGWGNEKTDPDNFKERFKEIYQWSTNYGEVNFSDTVGVLYGQKSLPFNIGTFDWPKRAIRGFPLGMYHGVDLTNYVEIVSDNIEEAIEGLEEDVIEAVDEVVDDVIEAAEEGIESVLDDALDDVLGGSDDEGRTEYLEQCIIDREGERDQLANNLRINKRGDKEDEYNASVQAAIDNGDPPPPVQTNFQLTAAERQAIDEEADAEILRRCNEAYDEIIQEELDQGPELPEGDEELPPFGDNEEENPFDPGSLDTDNPIGSQEHRNREDQQRQAGSGLGLDPKGAQNLLEFFNWMFEVHYQAMALPPVADSVSYIAHRALGNDTCPENIPGFICVYDTPMYAVYGQRIIPEFVTQAASAGADAIGIPPDLIPPEIMDGLSSLGRVLAADRDDWSLLIAQQAPLKMLFAPTAFGNIPQTVTVFAQSEVYNSEWFDLFTQSWKAKLVPVSLPVDDYHRPNLEAAWTDKVDFISVFETFQNEEQRIMNH